MSPVTSHPFFHTGGAVPLDAQCYIYRQADKDLFAALLRGEFCYVLLTRQIGKSSLMVRTAAQLRREGVAAVVLDLNRVGHNLEYEQWYYGLIMEIARRLDIRSEVKAFWDREDNLSPLQKWIGTIEHILIHLYSGRLVLFIDEIDQVRLLPPEYSIDEFFTSIRSCYSRRTEDPEFNRLTFCLLGVALPSDLIKDARITPFNIGTRIELVDFDLQQVLALKVGLKREEILDDVLIERVFYWTNGHPYLTQRLCSGIVAMPELTTPQQVDALCERLFLSTDAREQDDNLIFVRDRLLQSEDSTPELLRLYKQICHGRHIQHDKANRWASVLLLSGIVRASRGELKVRNRIYERVFNQDWLDRHLPGEAEKLQKRRYQVIGGLKVGIPSLIVLALIGFLSISNLVALHREQHLLYSQRLALIHEKWDNGEVSQIAPLLRTTQSSSFRGLEWNFWKERCNLASASFSVHRDNVNAVVFSTDGRFFATASDDGTIGYWNAIAHRLIKQWLTPQEHVYDIAFSPDGRYLLSAGHKEGAILWDVQQSRIVSKLPMQNDRAIGAVAYSPLGDLIATASDDGSTTVWKGTTGKKIYAIPPKAGQEEHAVLAFSPNGKHLVTCIRNQALLWDAYTGKVVEPPLEHLSPVLAIAFSHDGQTVVTGCHDGTLSIWDAVTGTKRFDLHNPTEVHCLNLSLQDDRIFVGSSDAAIRIWNARAPTSEPLGVLLGHTESILGMALSPDGTTLLSVGEDRSVKLWMQPATYRNPLRLHSSARVNALVYTPDGQGLITAQGDFLQKEDNIACLWNMASGTKIKTFQGHDHALLCAAIDAQGQRLVTGDTGGAARLWDLRSGRCLLVTRPADREVKSVLFAPHSANRFMTAWHQGFTLWDAAGHKIKEHYNQKDTTTSTLDWSGDALLTSGGEDTVRLWDSRAFEQNQPSTLLSRQFGHHDPDAQGHTRIWPAVFSPDGKAVATGGTDKAVRIWDARNGHLLHTLWGHTASVHCIAFSQDGHRLLTGGDDFTVRLWDLDIESELFTLHHHQKEITAVAIAPDDSSFATAGADGNVVVWRLKNNH